MANEILNEEEKQSIKKMELFLKEAFCIDGECFFIENISFKSSLKTMEGQCFSLGDSKRGMFYVTISK